MIALYASVFALISLFFEYIDYVYPDALNSYVDPYSGSMRSAIATLLVLFPLFLVLMRLIRNDIVREPAKKDLWVRRWALFLTVFVAGATIAIDLITLVNYFLGGDVTMRFALKVAIVLLVAGGGFMHFLADIWGYWIEFPKRAQWVGWGAGAVILLSVAASFLIMGTPAQIRLYRFDDQKVSDLTSIQWQIVNYFQQKEKLPETLFDLVDPISGFVVPIDPETNMPYRYERINQYSFKLCATFNQATRSNTSQSPYTKPALAGGPIGGTSDLENQTWYHGTGDTCFARTIDPERYPPFKKSDQTVSSQPAPTVVR